MSESGQKKGLYGKYIIKKTNGKPIDENAKFFVLRIDRNQKDKHHERACRSALFRYAKSISSYIPKLSEDLLKYLEDTE